MALLNCCGYRRFARFFRLPYIAAGVRKAPEAAEICRFCEIENWSERQPLRNGFTRPDQDALMLIGVVKRDNQNGANRTLTNS